MANEVGAFLMGGNLVLRPSAATGFISTEGNIFDQQSTKSHIGFTGSAATKQTFAISTTDATVTTICTIPVATNTCISVRALITAFRTGTPDGVGCVIGPCAASNNAGAVALVAASTITLIKNSAGVPAVTTTISGTNLLIQVAGIAAQNYAWVAVVETVAVATSA